MANYVGNTTDTTCTGITTSPEDCCVYLFKMVAEKTQLRTARWFQPDNGRLFSIKELEISCGPAEKCEEDEHYIRIKDTTDKKDKNVKHQKTVTWFAQIWCKLEEVVEGWTRGCKECFIKGENIAWSDMDLSSMQTLDDISASPSDWTGLDAVINSLMDQGVLSGSGDCDLPLPNGWNSALYGFAPRNKGDLICCESEDKQGV